MSELRSGKREFHGALKHGKRPLEALTGGGSQTVSFDASKVDVIEISSDCTGSTAVTFEISNASEGQQLVIRYLSGGASDSIAAINVDGVAADEIGTFNDSAENSIQVIVYDASTSHALIHG